MAATETFLVEIGTEELPPGALVGLASAFCDNLLAELADLNLDVGREQAHWYASPRRLALRIDALPLSQPDIEEQRLGPAVAAAFDAQGQPTRAAEGFARSCGAQVDALEQLETDKGTRLAYTRKVTGQPSAELLVGAVERALSRLPVPRPMRWGDHDYSFVRPVHWVVMLHGESVIHGELLGQRIGRQTRGHRFHHAEPVSLDRPQDYVDALMAAKVMVDFAARRQRIAEQVEAAARQAGGQAVIGDALLDEVTNLVEWPVALVGSFDEAFLQVPAEALISSMETHQKFFPMVDDQGQLLPRFVAVSNIESRDPAAVATGYGRVIRPRLADARFFWDQDRKRPLEDRQSGLEAMVYQKQLGSLWDKSLRVRALAAEIARLLDLDPTPACRAAELAKCDLLTEMVGEFPELQGIMGRYYAQAQGEPEAVAWAIEEHYRPRFAGDALPASPAGRVLAIADRLDTLAGIFAAGMKPSGNKDPFALRRAALGLARLLIEAEIDLDLALLIDKALAGVAERIPGADQQADAVMAFVIERMRAWYTEQGVSTEVFNAVAATHPRRPLDFHQRIAACRAFAGLDAAEALAAANKRAGNILRKSEGTVPESVDAALLSETAELDLAKAVETAQRDVTPLIEQRRYQDALERLAELRTPVDRFFDDVMVMAEDPALRANRLALLAQLKALFDGIADVSELARAR